MTRQANYDIVADPIGGALVIRDVGPWDKFMTITNAAEEVVAELIVKGRLAPGRRLLYFDSEGELTELLIKQGKFIGFKTGAF